MWKKPSNVQRAEDSSSVETVKRGKPFVRGVRKQGRGSSTELSEGPARGGLSPSPTYLPFQEGKGLSTGTLYLVIPFLFGTYVLVTFQRRKLMSGRSEEGWFVENMRLGSSLELP
jgi:hypothetical protein